MSLFRPYRFNNEGVGIYLGQRERNVVMSQTPTELLKNSRLHAELKLADKGLEILPSHMRESAHAWVHYGRPGGHFLNAIIRGDMREAYRRADFDNRAALEQWIRFFVEFTPPECGLYRAASEVWPVILKKESK